MKISTLVLLAIFGIQLSLRAAEVAAQFPEAERFYREGSFKRAHEEYQKAGNDAGTPEEKRWVQLRLAETQARSEASTRQPDDSVARAAEAELRKFIEENQPMDRVWAETHEALGDLAWHGRQRVNWGGGWPHYEKALDYWAGSTNLTYATGRYWNIVGKASQPQRVEPYYYYGYYGNYLPLRVLENALKIARNEDERARAHFMIAMTLRSQGGAWEQRFRIPHEFDAALKLKKDTGWYDDALYYYGEWMSQQGAGVQDEQGNWTFQPDYSKALEVFRRLTTEFREGESQWFDDAQNRIREITAPSLNVSVGHVFLPGSEIEFHLNWRNVDGVEFTLYKADLTKAISLRGETMHSHTWVQGFDSARGEKVKSWKWTPKMQRPHAPGNEVVRLEEKLPLGAYVLLAQAGGAQSREIILVSDLSIVTQSAGGQVLVYVCDAGNGSPAKNAEVRLWEKYHDGSNWHWTSHEKTTDGEGIALYELNRRTAHREILVLAKTGERQAFSVGHSSGVQTEGDAWKIYASTDKPAYRPGEKVHWKIVARRPRGETYTVPSDETISLRITDPRGAELRKEKIKLNNFGSGWGELELSSEQALGAYSVTFMDAKEKQHLGQAELFRMEEYKLPEFKVAVQTPEVERRKKTFLLGEKVEVEIAANYYFGGAVANATVEVVVHQNQFHHYWTEPREFDWYFQEGQSRRPRDNGGQVVQRETLKTDAEGKAKLTIQSPLNQGSDLEYRIEARVVDASRREIVGNGTVRVTRQRFYVYPKPLHRIYKPQDKVEVEFKALDANQQPVVAEGKVRVTRDFWYEIWLAPNGREVKGDELKRLQSAAIFPPAPQPGQPGWRLKFRGYQHDEITTQTLKTGTNGVATVSFTAEREGYYKINWRSDENLQPGEGKIPGRPVHAETAVWVATKGSVELGYRSGGLEILIDKETFKAGEKTPVMLSAPGNDRYVLFTVSGNDLIDYQLVHLNGSVKLLELAIDEKHVPNAFLNAAMVSDQQIFADQEEIVVPPVKNFLTVDVKSDREQFQPGEKGTLRITTRNHEGQPVSAEVALGMVDESVYYIQDDYAGDPRQFFFGDKRHMTLSTSSSFNTRSYHKLLPKNEEELVANESRDELLGRKTSLNYRVSPGGRMGRYGGAQLMSLSDSDGSMRLDSLAAAPAPKNVMAEERQFFAKLSAKDDGMEAKEAPESTVQVRTDFRSAIFWQPDIKTDAQGQAEVTITYPDTLTAWKATARGVTTRNQFGIADVTTRTKQPLIVRLQGPRFFLVGDSVTVSAVINNNTDEELSVTPAIESVGIDLPRQVARAMKIAAGGEARMDWVLHPRKSGEIKLKVTARGGKYADAMERAYTVYEHGIEKFIATSGKGRGDEVFATLHLPAERKEGTTTFSVQVTPSLAVTMLDALPYLVNYSYGCTEQTMSRFLPATITAKTLKDLGLKPEDILGRVFGGIEKRNPKDGQNLEKLNDVTEKGLQRLYDFQHGDGGWGWWKEGESDSYMTAYVVWGLTLARDAGVQIKADALNRAASYLDKQLVQAERSYDLQTWMLHALATKTASDKGKISEFQTTAFDNLWNNREQLNAYTRALFALSAHQFGKANEARTLIRNLENGVKMDEAPGRSVLTPGRPAGRSDSSMATAHWGEDGMPWRWSEGGIEATAFALRALLAIDPKHKLVDPVANWLIKNRRGAQWSNTRDTAIVLLALNDYLRVTREIEADLEFEVVVNGTSLGGKKITGADVFNAPTKFTVPARAIRDGANEIKIVRKSGKSPIYFAAECAFFSLEEPITAAGHEIFVKRQYFRLQPVPTLLKGFTYEKVEVRSGDEVASGERIETVLTIESKNNYEYLVFEDLKPAGLEAVEVRSGESLYAKRVREASLLAATGSPGLETAKQEQERYTGDMRWVFQELRDRKVALFLDKLPEGFWEIRYESRAEMPGEFHALPVIAHAMYVPEIRANSAETVLRVIEAKN